MKDYFDEGIRHFYFMMLQKDEVSPDERIKGRNWKFANSNCFSLWMLQREAVVVDS